MWIGEYDCRLAAGYRMWPPKTPDGNTNISTGSRTSTCPGADTMEQVPVQRHSFKLRLELRLTLLQQAAVQRVARALRDHPSMSELAIGDQNIKTKTWGLLLLTFPIPEEQGWRDPQTDSRPEA